MPASILSRAQRPESPMKTTDPQTGASPTDPHDNRGKWNAWYRGLSSRATATLRECGYLSHSGRIPGRRRAGRGLGLRNGRLLARLPYASMSASTAATRRLPAASPTFAPTGPTAEGILIRHVLEHNYDWETDSGRARSNPFGRSCASILFTPFAAETTELSHNREVGIDAPNLSLARADIEAHFDGLSWRLIAGHPDTVSIRHRTRLSRLAQR